MTSADSAGQNHTDRPQRRWVDSVLHTSLGVRACLFDLDGVLTDTAGAHTAACKEVGDSKNAYFLRRIRNAGVKAYPGSVRYVQVLGVEPGAAAAFEDALSGVAASRAGGFGLVVGVDRVGQVDELREHGADRVVTDLAQLLDPAKTFVSE